MVNRASWQKVEGKSEHDDHFEYGEEVELTEDSGFVNLSSKTKYIGCIQRDDASSMVLFGDNFSLDYSDDESSIVSMNDIEKSELPWMLIIDEIDNHHGKNLDPPHFVRTTTGSKKPSEEKEAEFYDRLIPNSPSLSSKIIVNLPKKILPSTSFVDSIWKINEESTTTCYEVKRSLVQGWLYKKGTGNDIFKRRCWKPRWCNLALASIDGCEIDVPILLVSWHPSIPLQSNVIILDSTVTVTINWENEEGGQSVLPCFDIACVKIEVNNVKEVKNIVIRSFCAPLEEREQWTREINKALLDYERSKLRFSKQNSRRIMDCDGYNVTEGVHYTAS